MPRLTVVAGPNGSGKSTLTRMSREAFQDTVVLDPDAIARKMHDTNDSDASAMDAGREVLRTADQMLERQESFLVETTLSGNTYLRMMSRARQQGYFVVLLFVGTSDVQINLRRVQSRVIRGGHDVPAEDQLRRYPRSMAKFRKAFSLADEAAVFDNSGSGHQRVAVKDANGVTLFEPVPEWAAFLRSC